SHQIYGQRKIDVEPIFANLKAHLGFKRFSVRGLSATWNEVGIALMANNLVKLAKVSANLKGMDKNRKEILTNREFPSCFFIESELCPELFVCDL
ncbi:transposase, partial [Levilactobacillus brevis]